MNWLKEFDWAQQPPQLNFLFSLFSSSTPIINQFYWFDELVCWLMKKRRKRRKLAALPCSFNNSKKDFLLNWLIPLGEEKKSTLLSLFDSFMRIKERELTFLPLIAFISSTTINQLKKLIGVVGWFIWLKEEKSINGAAFSWMNAASSIWLISFLPPQRIQWSQLINWAELMKQGKRREPTISSFLFNFFNYWRNEEKRDWWAEERGLAAFSSLSFQFSKAIQSKCLIDCSWMKKRKEERPSPSNTTINIQSISWNWIELVD